MKITNRKDILLLLLYSPGSGNLPNEPVCGRTRLVKMLFLFKEELLPHFKKGTEISAANFYDFFAWHFGPFSTQVYDDITFFMLRGFIECSTSEEEVLEESAAEWDHWLEQTIGGSEEITIFSAEEIFTLSKEGTKFAQDLFKSLSGQQAQLLKEFKQRLNKAPIRAILKYVYTKYPNQTERSLIKEDILGN